MYVRVCVSSGISNLESRNPKPTSKSQSQRFKARGACSTQAKGFGGWRIRAANGLGFRCRLGGLQGAEIWALALGLGFGGLGLQSLKVAVLYLERR